MVKHTQTIRRQQATNCFLGLTLKGLNLESERYLQSILFKKLVIVFMEIVQENVK